MRPRYAIVVPAVFGSLIASLRLARRQPVATSMRHMTNLLVASASRAKPLRETALTWAKPVKAAVPSGILADIR